MSSLELVRSAPPRRLCRRVEFYTEDVGRMVREKKKAPSKSGLVGLSHVTGILSGSDCSRAALRMLASQALSSQSMEHCSLPFSLLSCRRGKPAQCRGASVSAGTFSRLQVAEASGFGNSAVPNSVTHSPINSILNGSPVPNPMILEV